MLRNSITALAGLLGATSAFEFYTFDGPGSPSCHNVVEVHNATSVAEMASLVKDASRRGLQVRAGGKGHMWYDTQCSDNETVIIRTEFVNGISDFDLEGGSVVVEGGVTFFQLAEYLHERGANIGTGLVNWNITLGGSIAMGAHRTSLREDAVVVGGVLALEIIDGNGDIRTVFRDESNEDWLAASTSLGLLGIIARIKMQIFPESKVYAMQTTLQENDVLNGDIYKLISPYLTANFWWWPSQHKFHWRTYDIVPTNTSSQLGFQSTFSVTALEAGAAVVLLNSGKYSSIPNLAAEGIFFGLWEKPNFHDKVTDAEITDWPVYGWNYDVLIGGLYPGQKPEWEYGLKGYTLELAFPVTRANEVLKRIRALFDAETAKGMPMASTYRSGINIKFGKAHFDFLGQVTTDTADGQDWSKGAIMFDFPSFRPSLGDEKRYNEAFYINLANTLVDEFPCRPHWTKNTRDVFKRAVKNLDPSYLSRFKAVRQKFDPKGIYRSVVGEIIGMYD
ncbi:FAD/FMN-containing dehydrogenase [Trichoderma gamsii]|uniref:D-arabinono-1,4-lactone oxidase n=1 Tax=Trichoderma gamsii TaxID=398673 RepID=A0A2P4ZEU4_9HYPO|nr:FAD/FMN-containing dehydrogenase [Trichoderma gamsii]PON22804.1 FAD/FMN-containing dehydrogenase [Trichoderma gamsii]